MPLFAANPEFSGHFGTVIAAPADRATVAPSPQARKAPVLRLEEGQTLDLRAQAGQALWYADAGPFGEDVWHMVVLSRESEITGPLVYRPAVELSPEDANAVLAQDPWVSITALLSFVLVVILFVWGVAVLVTLGASGTDAGGNAPRGLTLFITLVMAAPLIGMAQRWARALSDQPSSIIRRAGHATQILHCPTPNSWAQLPKAVIPKIESETEQPLPTLSAPPITGTVASQSFL